MGRKKIAIKSIDDDRARQVQPRKLNISLISNNRSPSPNVNSA